MFSNGSISRFSYNSESAAKVLRWKTMVEEECNAQGVSELVPYVLGIIMVESGGDSETTPDIMQSSESQGRPANSINNPKESIHYGVMHLKERLQMQRITALLI